MDSQLAFFLVRPAKAMGRKGADPDAVILAGHWSTPADRTNDVPICKPDFFTRKMWGWGVTSPEAVAPGTAMTGPGQGCSGEGLPCAQPLTFPSPSHADGQGRVSALGSLGLTPPRAGFEPDLAPHCTPKASFAAGGVLGWGLTGVRLDWWGSLGSPLIPRANTAGLRGGNGVTHAHQPSFPSQGWGLQGVFPPKRCLMEGGTLHGPHQCHAAGDSDCTHCCHPSCGGSRVFTGPRRVWALPRPGGSRVCPGASSSEEALRTRVRVSAAQPIRCGVRLAELRWFEASSYGYKASSVRREKSSLPFAPPAAFPLRSLTRALGWDYFHSHSGWYQDDAPPNPTHGGYWPARGVHASCPARCHRMAPVPRGTRASSHSAKDLGPTARPRRQAWGLGAAGIGVPRHDTPLCVGTGRVGKRGKCDSMSEKCPAGMATSLPLPLGHGCLLKSGSAPPE